MTWRPTPPERPDPYRCALCGHWYTSVGERQPMERCLVLHPPGECCHYKERRVDDRADGDWPDS